MNAMSILSRELPPKGLLKRSTTFDERPKKQLEGGFQSLRRNNTFVTENKNADIDISPLPNISYQEVLYRRYFGFENSTELNPVQMRRMVKSRSTSMVSQDRDDNKYVIVIDTFSTGAMLSYLLYKAGYRIIRVLSADLGDLLDMVPEGLEGLEYHTTITLNTNEEFEKAFEDLTISISQLGYTIQAVFPGAETGVLLADKLSEYLKLRTNGTSQSEARRNKYVMGETVRAAGVRAVRQLRSSVWSEIKAWLDDWKPNPYKVIVKPLDSAGSDDVTLCLNVDEVKNAFGNIVGKVNGLGLVNRAVLVQEFLEGQEYVIDTVSRDGEHKVVAIWAYDRRAANGGEFVCFGQRLLTMADEHCEELVSYQLKVLDALGVKNGPTHGEVKWHHGEPVLIEVGARCHGGDGLWVQVASEVIGYNQVQCSIDAYLHGEAFNKIPARPVTRLGYGAMKWLINSTADGKLIKVDPEGVKELAGMSSYRGVQFFKHPGEQVHKTYNCFTWMGCVCIANKDEKTLEADYKRVLELERETLFHIEVISEKSQSAVKTHRVAVVDPFSTGAVVAHLLMARDIEVVAVYSAKLEQLGNLLNLVPKGITLNFVDLVAFDDIEIMATKLKGVTDVVPGTETGVELADKLSEYLKLRTNGTSQSEARRNKYVMGETVRAAGVRAVRQLRSSDLAEIEAWLNDWKPNPYQVIVKPLDSAGSDGVTLCMSLEEVRQAFNDIIGKVNGLGLVNNALLVQEYLTGQEYVIDTVSRDGEHKVVAIWAYDRRAANGGQFVNFGQRLLTISDEHCEEIVKYQLKVLDALGIKHGPTHGEVKWHQGEPVLIEVGARCHGGEGAWVPIADSVYGYNQVSVALDSYLDEQAFKSIPSTPSKSLGAGVLLFLIVKNVSGEYIGPNAALLKEMQEDMPSVMEIQFFPKPGDFISPTKNCFGWGGCVAMFHKSQSVLDRDYQRIRVMEDIGLFEVK